MKAKQIKQLKEKYNGKTIQTVSGEKFIVTFTNGVDKHVKIGNHAQSFESFANFVRSCEIV